MHRLALLIALVACKSDKPADPPPAPPAPRVAPATIGPTLDPGTFDRACAAATDCVVVKKASCDPCACAADAIASKAMAQFDEAAAKLDCGAPDLPRSMDCAACPAQIAACESGVCIAKLK